MNETQQATTVVAAFVPSQRGWSDEQDGAFFAITAGLFPPAFLFGAGVLLAGNDPE